MRLFHFSEEPDIAVFVPRPVRVPSIRRPGQDWLNGPLVWAIDEAHQAMYLFPRDCPRILLWPTPATTHADHAAWWGKSDAAMIAFIEDAWLESLRTVRLTRYELPAAGFQTLDDAGMWVSRETVVPIAAQTIADLPAALATAGVELRVMERLTPLRHVWETSLHASGIRLRHAQGWDAQGDA